MLIEFIVKNYRSIKEEQIFSMVKASKIKEDELSENNAFTASDLGHTELLSSTAIYGANAAGKSNLINAIRDMEYIVRRSASSFQEGDKLQIEPFIFDEETSKQPSEFEVSFISEGVKYQYGFSATNDQIFEEWLIAFPKKRPQKWFSRVFDRSASKYDYKFSDNLVGAKNVWQSSTRSNALFLSTAVQLNSEQLRPVFNWFRDTLRPADIESWGPAYTASLCQENEFKEKIINLMQSADFNIHDISVDTEKFDSSLLPEELSDTVKSQLMQDLRDKEIFIVNTFHKSKSGRFIPIELSEESDGTQKLFSLAGPLLDVLDKGRILVVDELNNSLHPKMIEGLIKLFHNRDTNKHNAQLIFSTHDPSILNQDVFRRDQIWFCEKDQYGETSVYPLTDFSPRKGNRENLELGYLSGRYGGVPFINSLIN